MGRVALSDSIVAGIVTLRDVGEKIERDWRNVTAIGKSSFGEAASSQAGQTALSAGASSSSYGRA